MAFKAELLRERLKAEGKSRDDLAAAIKKHKRTVSRWLAGTNPPKPKDLEAIARILNCKPQDFDPFFADMGLGEVSIQAHVSAASHNAYELMRWRYGVSQKQIMELAPILFAIVAGHALKVPEQDEALEREAQMRGRPSTQMIGDHIDRQASKLRRCFGLTSPDPINEPSRNLFDTAIHRLSVQVADYVDAGWYVGAEAGDVPGAAGYIPDTDFLEQITGGNRALAEAIVKGRIRLSMVLQQAKEGKDQVSVEQFAEAIRRANSEGIEEQRRAGLKKLDAWRAYYADLYPDLAEEYDRLVAQHCHEEGWYPDNYTSDDRIQSWVNPFHEDRYINTDTLVEYQSLKAAGAEKGKFVFVLPEEDPIYRRFHELERHRARIKKQFEETWA